MFSIDYKSRTPIYRQIVENIEKLAAHGILGPDEQLPSVRALAVELSINPNTIAKSYNELEAKGVIYSLPGKGSFVSSNSESLRQQAREDIAGKLGLLANDAARVNMSKEEFLDICQRAWQEHEAKGEQHHDSK